MLFEEPSLEKCVRYFFEKAVHQPLGLIDPSTMLQVPLAVAELPGLKNLHCEHCCPWLGVL